MVLTSTQVRSAEEKAVFYGMSWLRLMENAGAAAAKEIRDEYELSDKRVVIVCGKGNNGGDGFVIARKLLENEINVRVISMDEPNTPGSKEMYAKIYSLGLRAIDFEKYESLCCKYISDADIVIDAIFGIGFKGELSDKYKKVITAINQSNATKIAIDIPSGLNCNSGYVDNLSVIADFTVTFSAYKLCQVLFPSSNYCGKVKVVSIGMPSESFEEIVPEINIVSEEMAANVLPVRPIDCHKGICGTAGLFVGNKGFSGAAVIAGNAAIKSGAGIVNMIIPNNIYNIVGSALPEAICTVLDDNSYNNIHSSYSKRIIYAFSKCTAGLIGCGLTQSEEIKSIITDILKYSNIPLVIDADGINMLSDSIELLRQYGNEVVLTPHPKEASRLLGCSVEKIQSDRLSKAKELCHLTGAVVVLKGAKTIIACRSGKAYCVTDGNPAMATAGTGDMLAGMIVSFMAQGLSAEDSALCSVKAHAMSGDMAVKSTSVLSLTPSDMLRVLPDIYCRLYSRK